MKQLFALAALFFAACNDTNVGSLLAKKEQCVGTSCEETKPDLCTSTTASIACGVGECTRVVAQCTEGQFNFCDPGLPNTELCNNLDDDCDGTVDNGCDDDGDEYCDAEMTITGRPAICPRGGSTLLDCDDEAMERHPEQTEICDDAVDNDCNDFADYLDFNGCTHITASFQDSDGLITLEHGTSAITRAVLTPPTLGLARKWSVASATPDTQCATSDVMMTDALDTEETTERRLAIVDDPNKLDCEYRIVLTIADVVADNIRLRMRNTRPRVDEVVGAALDDSTLVVYAASGRDPHLTAVMPVDVDEPVTISWGGRDVGLLDCTGTCEGTSMMFKMPPVAGSYTFVLSAHDSFDRVPRTRNLRVEIVPCVWARAQATGSGTGPALADAYGSLSSAISAATTQRANVCLAGTGRMSLSSRVTLATGVGISGGFSTAGVPAATKGAIRTTNGAHLAFAAGYTGSIRRVVIDSDRASTLLNVTNASPSLYGVELLLSSGTGSRGIFLQSTGSVNATVRLASSSVRSNGAQVDATAIDVRGADSGVARLIWNGASTIELTGCSGLCRGISLFGSTSASLTAERIDVEASGAESRAYGISIAGTSTLSATAEIRSINTILARTTAMDPADVTVAVQLERTRGVSIASNLVIGPTTHDSGRRFSAGIADGSISRDGTVLYGGSAGLTINANRQINAGRSTYAWTGVTCDDEAQAREGSDIASGIVLVGSSTVVVSNNGDNASRDYAVFGGASSATWNPADRPLPPSVPAIWTVDTTDVRIVKNELRNGVFSMDDACPTLERPSTVVVRDGLGPFVNPALASRNLRLEKNGLVSGRRSSFDAVPNIDNVAVRMIELSGGDILLVNNYIAATRGIALIGVYAHRTEHLEMWNNVVELESLGPPGSTARKYGVLFDDLPPGSLNLINNIILLREDAEDVSDPIALYERSNGEMQAIGVLNNNIFFVEANERAAVGAYVAIEGGMRYSRLTFDDYATAVGGLRNMIVPPLFQGHAMEQRRSLTRLSSRSPARDSGQEEGAPEEDRFANARPAGAGVDIGHHELSP
jgi:hypothetical protein